MNKKLLFALGAAVVVICGVLATVLFLQPSQPKNDSAEAISLFVTGAYKDSSFGFDWTTNAIGSTSKTDIESRLNCPAEATEVYVFLATPGQERDSDFGWLAYAQNSFVNGTKSVLTPNFKPSGLVNGAPGASYLKRIGGDYSLGLACTVGAKKNVLSVSYRSIKVESQTGKWNASPEPSINQKN